MEQSPPQDPKISTTDLEKDMANLLHEPAQSSSTKKTVEDVIAEMVLETALAEAKDLMSMMKFALPSYFGRITKKPGDEPSWYSPQAMYYAADPWRRARSRFTKKLIEDHKDWISDDWKGGKMKVLDYGCGTGIASQALAPHVSNIVGVDEDETMTPVYNEIATRLGHATCTMQAYTGNIMPDQPYEIKGFPTSETFGDFDLVVVVLAMDCFEILHLSPSARHQQLLDSLRALVGTLSEGGTLLIIDMERDTQKTDEMPVLGGKKLTGYHSSDIVKALGDMDMEGVDVLEDRRFQWTATPEESKTCMPAEADSVFFMLKAKKKPESTRN